MNIDVHAIAGKFTGHTPEDFVRQEDFQRAKAIDYLKAKFPNEDEKVFRTDYIGQTYDDVISFWAVAQAAELDGICEYCDGTCRIPEGLKSGRPVISVSESPKGFRYLEVRWTCGLSCKKQPLTGEFERMIQKSEIRTLSQNMTFENYENTKATLETNRAKCEAMKAAKEQTCLILAGKPGTGKTHLATAVAIYAMKHGRQAIFRLVSSMLDEIQTALSDRGGYDSLMMQFKTVPCLVLDDLGHENMTAARASYLNQIIDYRYGENLQTIVTTNAKNADELSAWDKEEYIMPIVSRLIERGTWVTIENAEDFRMK